MNIRTVVHESSIYNIGTTLFRWFEASRTWALLSTPVVIRVILAGFVTFSIVSVMYSNMNEAIKFLSFALLFIFMTFLILGFTEPSAES
jgi:hypothetical protein